MTNSINTFETVQTIKAINIMNEDGANQSVLLDLGELEFFQNEGGYSIYYTTFDGDCKYITDANNHVMDGDIARTYDAIIEVINEQTYN